MAPGIGAYRSPKHGFLGEPEDQTKESFVAQAQDTLGQNSGADRLLDQLMARSRRVLDICDLLEALADDLPRRSAPIWRETKTQCAYGLRSHFKLIADLIVPMLLERSEGILDREDVILRVKGDCADLSHRVTDLGELFDDALSSSAYCIDAEALGFALRGHFEALRRYIGWETDVLWPLALRLFSPDDLDHLTDEVSAPAQV